MKEACMRRRLRRLFSLPAAAAACCFCLPVCSAVLAAQEEEDDEVYMMSAFEVTSEKDFGYRKTQAQTATRIAAEIKNTPLTVNVVGSEFLDDHQIDNMKDAFDYTSGISTTPDDVVRPGQVRLRGFAVSVLNVLRDGYAKPYFSNIDGVDRIEVVKGPVAAFFGRAEPGGIINYITKKPQFYPQTELEGVLAAYDKYKVVADHQGVIVESKLAYRVVASWEDSEEWRQDINWDKEYVLAGLTWRPRGDTSLSFHADYEYSDSFRLGGVNTGTVINHDFIGEYDPNRWWNPDLYTVDDEIRYMAGNELVYTDEDVTVNDLTGQTKITYHLGEPFDENPRKGQEYERLYHPDVSPELQPNTWPARQPPVFYIEEQNDQPGTASWETWKFWQAAQDYYAEKAAGGNPEYPDYPPFSNGPYFPMGRDWNPNGPGSYHEDTSHIASFEFRWKVNEHFDVRYGCNYLENSAVKLQQYNSDLRQDGYTLSPGQGFDSGSSIHGAAHSAFLNTRFTSQLDLTYNFDLGGANHTLLGSAQWLSDEFRYYNRKINEEIRNRRWIYQEKDRSFDGINILGGVVDKPNGLARPGQGEGYRFPGEGVVDIYHDPIPDVRDWAADFDIRDWSPASSNHNEEGYSLSYRGKYFSGADGEYDLYLMSAVRYETRTTRDISAGNPNPKEKPGTEGGTTPMFGFNYEVMEGLSVFGSYSESFQPPNRESPAGYMDPEDPNKRISLPDPANMRGIGYEFGFKTGLFDGKVSGQAAVFHLEKDDILASDTTLMDAVNEQYKFHWERDPGFYSGGAPADEPPELRNVITNTGKETVEGLEVDLVITPVNNYQIILAYSYLWEKEKKYDEIEMYGDAALAPGTGRDGDEPVARPEYYNWEPGYGFELDADGGIKLDENGEAVMTDKGFFKTSYLRDPAQNYDYYLIDDTLGLDPAEFPDASGRVPDIDPNTGEPYQDPALLVRYNLEPEDSFQKILREADHGTPDFEQLELRDAGGNSVSLPEGVTDWASLGSAVALTNPENNVQLVEMGDDVFFPAEDENNPYGIVFIREVAEAQGQEFPKTRKADLAGLVYTYEDDGGEKYTLYNKAEGQPVVLKSGSAKLAKTNPVKTPAEIKELWNKGIRTRKMYTELPNTPSHKFSLWNKYTFTEGMFENLELGLGCVYESSSLPGTKRVTDWRGDPHLIFNGMIGYKFLFEDNDELSLKLNVKNIFDEEYVKGSFGPGTPRLWSFSARYKF